MLVCIWCSIFPYCSTASCLVSDMIWDSLFEKTQAPDIKVGGVLCWELEPLFFNLFLFSSIFFRTFPLFSRSLPQLLSCLCVYIFLNEAWCFHDVLGCELITVKVTAWYKRESNYWCFRELGEWLPVLNFWEISCVTFQFFHLTLRR